MYTNCTLHKSIRSFLRLTWKQSCLHTSPIRDVKAFLHHSACCYNPLGTRNPSCFCYLLLHTYVPTYLLELCPKVIMWVNQGGNRSTLLLIYSSASGIPFLKSMYLPRSANLNDPTTQLYSSHHHTTTNPPRVLSHCGMKYRKIVSFMNFFVKLISRNFFVKSISRNFSRKLYWIPCIYYFPIMYNGSLYARLLIRASS